MFSEIVPTLLIARDIDRQVVQEKKLMTTWKYFLEGKLR
jgi:hypothetical protein